MEKVVWKALLDLIEPLYPKTSSKGGRRRIRSRHAPNPSAEAVVRPQRSSDRGCADRGVENALPRVNLLGRCIASLQKLPA
jgi:hypothetical protein